MVAMDIGIREFLSYHSNGCYEEETLYQKLESYRLKLLQKIGLIGSVQGEIKYHNLKNVDF